MQIHARHYRTLRPVVLDLQGDRLQAVREVAAAADPALPVVAPGLVNLQVNGLKGQEFTDPNLTPEAARDACLGFAREGVACLLPTFTTQSFETLSHCLSVTASLLEHCPDVRRCVPGFHLEGPYISAEDGPRGAHPREHVRAPQWDEFQRLQEAASGRILLVTLAPEQPGAVDFIRLAVASGVVVALGHTAADTQQIQQAVNAGATLSTHLGNGAHGLIRRHPNCIWDQLAEDRLTASLIADGHHLPPSVLKTFVRAKTVERCVLVSDLTGMGGMPPGAYDAPGLGAVEVLEDGRLVVAGQRQYLAGAALHLRYNVGIAMRDAELSHVAALEMASLNPRRLMGWSAAGLVPGAPADLLLCDLPVAGQPLAVRETWSQGVLAYSAERESK